MKDIEIGFDVKRNEVIIAMDGIEPTCWLSVTNVLQLRKARRLGHDK